MSTNTEAGPSKVQVTQPATVDAARTAEQTSTTAAPTEPSMAEYAKQRDAEARGEKYIPPQTDAATTEQSAAAADGSEKKDETEKVAAEQSDEELLAKIEDAPAKKGINERMSKLANDRKAAEETAKTAKAETEKAQEEAAAARKELGEIKARQETEAAEALAKAAVPAEKDDPKPDRDKFDDPDEYAIALAAYGTRQELRKANEATAKLRKETEEKAQAETKKAEAAKVAANVEELHKTFNERITAATPDYPDFAEKVSKNDKLIIRNEAFFLIEKSELGPHILYKLADDPEELKNINALAQTDPARMALRIGNLESDVRTARKPKASKAAEPHKPVGNRESPTRKTPDEESAAEYIARRTSEDRAAYKLKRDQRIH